MRNNCIQFTDNNLCNDNFFLIANQKYKLYACTDIRNNNLMTGTTEKLLQQIFVLRNKFGNNIEVEKLKLLTSLSQQENFTQKQMEHYFDLLLFLKAFADDKIIFTFCTKELERISLLIQAKKSLTIALTDSGIPNTNITGIYSYELVKWLREKYPEQIKLDAIDADDGKVVSIQTIVAGRVPAEILHEGHVKWQTWIRNFSTSNGDDVLTILIRLFEQSNLSSRIKEEMWSNLQLSIVVTLNSEMPSRSTQLFTSAKPFFHSALQKHFDNKKILNALPKEIDLSENDKMQIIDVSKMTLLCYNRETDPVTYAQAQNLKYYKLSNGLSVALFSLPQQCRQPIDSYIGYMAFKNGLPIAYGGGWILFDSCRIGVNIFPSYRGGESSFIFMQIISVYKNIFGVNRFTVDPYQIGKNNNDGIKSGAFWMYYHLGFRPIQSEIKNIADIEFKKISAHKNYRTPAIILRKFATSGLEFFVDAATSPVDFDSTHLSTLFQNIITKEYDGSFALANIQIEKLKKIIGLSKLPIENEIAHSWSQILISKKNPPSTLLLSKSISKFIKLKINNEWEYMRAMQKDSALKKYLQFLLAHMNN